MARSRRHFNIPTKVGETHSLTTSNGPTQGSNVALRNYPVRKQNEEMSHRWYQVLALHLAGMSGKDIAETTGYEPNTVSVILNHESMRALRQQLLADHWKEFEALQAKTIDVIRTQLDSQDAKIQLLAANMWLKAMGKYGQKITPLSISAEDVVVQILNQASGPSDISIKEKCAKS